ncbi:MAG: plasmid addiction system poison protein [Streptococcus sanguinis]|uniref:type II toxin-antitoxin system RelE family toxin n=1 Tax=Streptococcus sp. 20925_1_22 TaxID=3003645 RepID=UPI001CADA3C0|nr:plasmid addiction system poison protein [uncultured Streptococcus sp.]MBF1700097.1 plasmid addiction system poison protein [Streptococcus sanguinis]
MSGILSVYVRFRVGSYRIIAKVDDEDFVILNVHVGESSEVYKFRGRIEPKFF